MDATEALEGSVTAPIFHEGRSDEGDVKLRSQYLTYRTGEGIVAGVQLNVMFTLDRPAGLVWRYVRDSTLWQSGYGYYYTGVMGDLYSREDLGLGTETFDILVRKPGEPEVKGGPYVLLRAIPEYLIVQFQPVPEDGSNGGISPGFHVTMLSEHDGKTTVTVNMEHCSLTKDRTAEEALADWKALMAKADGLDFWRDHFVPALKELVYSDQEPSHAEATPGDEGTPTAPAFHEGRSYSEDDVRLRSRFFTFRGSDGIVAGKELNVMFTVDRPASEVWPFFRDPTLWQSGYGYHYTGVLGDLYSREDLGLGTETFDILVRKPGEPEFRAGPYVLVRAIPEYLIVQFQPVPDDGSNGGISPGFHVMMLNEHGGKTTITINMEHATRTAELSAQEAVAERKALAAQADGLDFWREHFIPDLKRLVYGAGK